jgi:hypothetical protein
MRRCYRWIVCLCAIAVLSSSRNVVAGAWTLREGDTQIISGVIYSTATESFDDTGGTVPTVYQKILLQSYAEHGLTDDITLVLAPEYAIATEGGPGRPTVHASDFAMKGGLRYLLEDSFGVLSVQASYKTAGAFDLSVSANNDSGSETELRLLYGLNFKLFGRDAYTDAEIAQRWISGARPDEVPVDLTVGLHWVRQIHHYGAELQHRSQRKWETTVSLLPLPQTRVGNAATPLERGVSGERCLYLANRPELIGGARGRGVNLG